MATVLSMIAQDVSESLYKKDRSLKIFLDEWNTHDKWNRIIYSRIYSYILKGYTGQNKD